MKPYYFLIPFLWLFTVTLHAQIDRSHPPVPSPAPKITLQEPTRFQLKNGLTVMVVENHKLPRVSIWLTLDNPPVAQGDKAGVSQLTSRLLGKGSQSIPKEEFHEEIDYLGATLTMNDKGASALCLSRDFSRVLELMASAALNPNFTTEAFEEEKNKMLHSTRMQEKDVPTIATRVQAALAYGKNHPHGEIVTRATINNITLADVQQYYCNQFVPANAYLVVVGDVTSKNVKQHVTQYFTSWTKATPPSFSYSKPEDAPYTQINFVEVPHATQSEIVVQYLTELRMNNEDYLPALLANSILGGGSQARLFKNLREDKAYTYGAYTSLLYDKYSPMPFRAYTQVRNAVTGSAVVQILKEIDSIATVPVTQAELNMAKANFAGRFVMELEKPETLATYALNLEIEHLPKDFYNTYLERLAAITIEDVQKAAQKYLSTEKARVVVIGKGSEVINPLEKVTFKGQKIPIHFYDPYANKIQKPQNPELLPGDVTATTILEKYLDAIGGKEKLKTLNSYAMWAEANVEGITLELETKKTTQNQFMKELKLMGHSMQKQVINGDKGYILVQEQHKNLSPAAIALIQEEEEAFPELDYLSQGDITLEGIEAVGAKQAYKLKITDQKTAFYDVETGLKLQEINKEALEPLSNMLQGQPLSNIFTFDNYQEVSGIKFPFALSQTIGPRRFEFIVKEIKVNEGVTPTDFQ